MPKDSIFELEPTTGNHDQEFLDSSYGKLKTFSISILEDIEDILWQNADKKNKHGISISEKNLKSFMKR